MSWTHTLTLSALILLSSCLTKDNPIVELPEDTKNPIQKTIDEMPLVVCDPLDGSEQGAGASSVDSNQGMRGRLFEGHVKINHFEDLVDPNTKEAIEGNSTLMDAQILMQNLDVPTRAFSEGFKIGEDRFVLGSDGEILMEDFGIQFESRLALGDLEPGYYELALLSDDGSILKIDTQNDVSDGIYGHTLLETNFTTPTRMSCANELVRIDESTTLPFELSYFQGPRYHIALVMLARKVKDLDADSELLITNPNSDPECGQKGNSRFFNSNNNSVPTQRFNDLLNRDWKVLSDQNFRLPGEKDVNYCIEGTNIIIDRNNCFREDVKYSTAETFEFLGDFDQVDFETLSVAIDGEFVESESFNIDYLNERLQFSTNPSEGSANLRVTYCLKEETPHEEQTPEAYFSYQVDENDPLTIHLNLLSSAEGDSGIESARYILNGGAGTIELSDTSYKSSVSYTFGDPNFYNIELVVTDSEGRTESFSRVIDLTAESQPPVVNFEVSQINTTEVFLDLNKSFAVQGYIEAGEIDFGDGTKRPIESLFETYTYASKGEYEVTVAMRDSYGNVSETSKMISVDESFATHSPVADFYIDKLDFAGGFRFYFAESGSPNGEIVDFTWQLGDGEIASGEEAMHFYEPGVYDVTLRVEDELGLTDTQTQRIVVHGGEPFIANIACWSEGAEAFCDWSVLDSGKNIQQVSIDWGDGIQEEMDVFNPEYELFRHVGHTYSENGVYEIEIGARNAQNDITFTTQSIEITGSENSGSGFPVAEASCFSTVPEVVECGSQSYHPDGASIVEYGWILPDGFAVSGRSYVFNSSEDQVDVIHYVVDQYGQRSETTVVVDVLRNVAPVAIIECSDEGPLKLSCHALDSFDSDGNVSSYRWQVNKATYSGPYLDLDLLAGDYLVELRVFDDLGAPADTFDIYNVRAPVGPMASIECKTDLLNLICDASSSSAGDFDISEYELDLGNGDVLTQASSNFDYDFDMSGTYDVVLKVKDSFGNTDEITTSVDVEAPELKFSAQCSPGEFFEVSCSIRNLGLAPIESVTWSMGDGEVLTGSTITHQYSQRDIQKVDLIVQDIYERSQQKEVHFELNLPDEPLVYIGGIPDDEQVLSGDSLNLSAEVLSVENTESAIISYEWKLDGTVVGSSQTLGLSFPNRKKYNVELSIENEWGEIDTASAFIYASEKPQAVIGVNAETGEAPLTLELNASQSEGYGAPLEYQWSLDQNEFSGEFVTYNLDEAMDYTVELTVTNDIGAYHKVSREITVNAGDVYLDKINHPSFMLSNREFSFDIPLSTGENGDYDVRVSTESSINYSLDSINSKVMFFPEEVDEGEHNLNVVLENLQTGEKFERTYNFIVFHYKEFYRTQPLSAGDSTILDLPGHPMDQTEIVIPTDVDSTNLELAFYEAKGDLGQEAVPGYFHIESSVELSRPVKVNPSREDIGIIGEVGNHSLVKAIKSEIGSFFVGGFYEICPFPLSQIRDYRQIITFHIEHSGGSWGGRKYKTGKSDYVFKDYYDREVDVRFGRSVLSYDENEQEYMLDSYKKARIAELAELFQAVKYSDPSVPIFFNHFDENTLGLVHPYLGSKIFLNEHHFMAKDSSLLEETYIHELEHVKQHRSMGCNAGLERFRWLQESAAEYSTYVNTSKQSDFFRSRYRKKYEMEGKELFDLLSDQDKWSYASEDEFNAYFSGYLWEYVDTFSLNGHDFYQKVFEDIGNGDFDVEKSSYKSFFKYLNFIGRDIERYLGSLSGSFRVRSEELFVGKLEAYYGEQEKKRNVLDSNGIARMELLPYEQKTVWIKRKDSQNQVIKISGSPSELAYDTVFVQSPDYWDDPYSTNPGCTVRYTDTQTNTDYLLVRPKESRPVESFDDLVCTDDVHVSFINPADENVEYEVELMDDPYKVPVARDRLIEKGLSNVSHCPAEPQYNFTEASSNYYWHFEVEVDVPFDITGDRVKILERIPGTYIELPATSVIKHDYIRWSYVGSNTDPDRTIRFSAHMKELKFEDVFGRMYGVPYDAEYGYPSSSCQ